MYWEKNMICKHWNELAHMGKGRNDKLKISKHQSMILKKATHNNIYKETIPI